MNLLIVFIIATTVVSLTTLFVPMHKELRKRRPELEVSKSFFGYYLGAILVSMVFSPYFFYLIFFGDCADFRYQVLKNILKSKRG